MGTAQQTFIDLTPIIDAIPEEAIISRHLSATDIIGEASELEVIVNEDIALFAKLPRFDMSLIETLRQRIDAFMVAYAQFEEVALEKGDALDKWKLIEPEAYAKKNKLIRHLRFAFAEENNKTGLAEILKISRGRGRRDLTLDYLQLSELAKKEAEKLASINYGSTDIARIEEIFEALKPLLGSLTTPAKIVDERNLRMQKAYTHLYRAMSTIRRYGQFIFAEHENRLNQYKSDEHQDRGSLSHSNESPIAM